MMERQDTNAEEYEPHDRYFYGLHLEYSRIFDLPLWDYFLSDSNMKDRVM